MIFETTYPDKEVAKSINQTVGQSFGFIQRIRLEGIGSHRIEVDQVSTELAQYINPGHSVNNINIELRPSGILVYLKKRTETYCWVIPYYELQTTDDLSEISDGAHFIHLKNAMQYNASFIKTLKELSFQSGNRG